jgi:PAS domain S-box-containing protein/putative nucleotidyltransferase with HDIG domain
MIACRTALLYAAYAGTWILFSDRLLAWLVADPALLTSLQTYKGWAFVAVTALLLYFALQHRVRALEQGEGKERRAVRSFRLLGRCNEAIALAKEEGALISEICRLLVEEGGYRMAWVGFAEGAPGKRVRPAAQAGFAEGYLDAVTITWDEAEIGRGPTGTCIRTGRPVACRDMLQDPAYAPWRDEATRRGYASSIALPLADEEGAFGALNIYAAEPEAFEADETALLSRLADTLALGIKSLRDREALTESKNRYRSLFEQATDAIFLVDAEGRIREANPAACAMLGYACEELLAKNLRELIPPEELAARPLRIDRAWEGEPLFFERKFRRKDGAVVITEAGVTKLESGLLLGVARDVTGRNQREEELRARNAELAALFELSTHLRAATGSAELLPIVLGELRRLLGADDGKVALLSPDRRSCTVAYGEGLWEGGAGLTIPVERCLCKPVVQSGEPYVSEDYGAAAPALPPGGAAEEKIGPVALVPLKSEEELVGVLWLARRRGNRPFTPPEVRFLSAVGEMTGGALRRLKLYEEAARRLRHTQALRNIDMAITGSLDLRVTFKVILDEITGQLDIDAAAILRLDPYSGVLRYEAWRGFRTVNPASFSLRLGEGHAGRAAQKRRSLIIHDLRAAEPDPAQGRLFTEEGFTAYYAVPLIAKGRVQGVLEVFHRNPVKPNGEWLEFLETMAGQAAVAIDNAELFYDLERSRVELIQAYDATLEGWAYALDLKDEETEGHSRRVTALTLRIAREMGVNQEELAHVRRGALLHDIGKMGIPDAVLLKPGKLTAEEWETMRRHPVYAFQMLSRIDYLRPALDIPYCHHEKWDGSGYPRGLKGEEIPLAARIFAVVDVYDALTSERPYRPAWPREKALEYIREESGKHFDPRVVELFLSLGEQEVAF